ncbi:hypothetical protein N7495_004391 [Penicillium taxi]|uniref:uncharacterized protein n=1 Tax=Penicillium taxi TaxID=168475 RepID=UPI0025457FB5|nr:uncharacterized protein N7495_004391 [Penicillium taxi]KAJ5899647.1 hypothetical protein N7495_004391 [Penicillium taxi]
MGVASLEKQLLEAFEKYYGFETTSYVIPIRNSYMNTLQKMISWLHKNSGDNNLRIYVYSGHANDAQTIQDKWYFGVIEAIPGKACYILDCCSTGAGATNPTGANKGGELIAVANWGQAAGASCMRLL